MSYSGRLALSWINKDKALIPADAGGYAWVPRDDARLSEVRLLREIERLGESVSGEGETENLVISGDSFYALRSISRIPEFASKYLGKVKLIYIDPPFNTGQSFADYDDSLEHSVWLGMMRERLLSFKDLLCPTGTLWVHLDDTEVHRARCLLDEIFGPTNFLASVIWQRTSAKSLARRTMGTMHETILVYGASEQAELKTVYLPLDEEYQKRYSNEDERGRYDTGDLTAGSHRPHLDSGLPWRGFDPSAIRRCWAVSRSPLVEAGYTDEQLTRMTMREKLDALDTAGYIHWPTRGGFPRFKKYLHKTKGRAIGSLWTDINVINSQAVERTGFSTQKPEALIQRILSMGSDPGDIVLDCFAGSGTTAAAAHKMKRRWIAIEREEASIKEYILPRLARVAKGEDPGGISAAEAWRGGGGFKVLEVCPSAYQFVDSHCFLDEWVIGEAFGEVVRAHLGFKSEVDLPFVGRQGRVRLAVIDGVVDDRTVRGLVARLAEDERTVIVGKAAPDGAADLLRTLSPGSKLLKAPRDLIAPKGRIVR